MGLQDMTVKPVKFYYCEKCGKRLIGRQSNGIWHFVFGKKKTRDGKLLDYCPVEMFIHGSVQMRCIDRDCGHMNTLNYFPEK